MDGALKGGKAPSRQNSGESIRGRERSWAKALRQEGGARAFGRRLLLQRVGAVRLETSWGDEPPVRSFCTGFWLEVAGVTHVWSNPSS